MKLKKLEGILENLDVFEKPKVQLEQYPTTAHIASHMLYTIDQTFDEIQGKMIGDLGCGCGILSVGSAILGSSFTVGFDVDEDALEIAKRNLEESELNTVELVQCDVANLETILTKEHMFDIIIMNPPFGTKNNTGIDMLFLEKSISLAKTSVYSLHKTATREHIQNKVKHYNVKMEVLAELRFNLEASYKFHRRKSVDIVVDFIRFDVSDKVGEVIDGIKK